MPPLPSPIPAQVHGLLRRHSHGVSDVGRLRPSNEDAFFCDDLLGLYVVADGMGGHAAGEVASSGAIDAIYGMVKRGIRELQPLSVPLVEAHVRAALRLLESAVQSAAYMIFSIAELDREKTGMGTTISALLVWGDFAVTAQVGDSRIYRVTGNSVDQLTEDHTLIAWQIQHGLITEQEATKSPHKNVITRAVGSRDYVEVDTRLLQLEAGHRFLLCSDGLHRYLKPGDVDVCIALGAEAAATNLVELANVRGGKDNITALIVEID
jgi:protein phosphatase